MSDPQPTGAFTWTQEPWGRALRCTMLEAPHFFTSSDVMLRESADEWNAVAASIGVARDRLLLIRQVHGSDVAVARRGSDAPWTMPEADVIITDDPDVAIGVRVADCAPVLLHDPVRHAVGAVHAGWRGTAKRAVVAGVEAMRREFNTNPADLVAAIGPCLASCCGEVGPDVVEAFRAGGATDADIPSWFSPGSGDRSFLDLPRANVDQLVSAGVRRDRIFESGLCTKTHAPRLHSYRAHGAGAGRMAAVIRTP